MQANETIQAETVPSYQNTCMKHTLGNGLAINFAAKTLPISDVFPAAKWNYFNFKVPEGWRTIF